MMNETTTTYRLTREQLAAANAPAPKAAPKATKRWRPSPVRLVVYSAAAWIAGSVVILPYAFRDVAPAPAPVATPVAAPVAAPVAKAAPAPEPAPSARYDAKERYINNVMLKAARNNLERCRQTYDQGDALGYAMCEKQREVYEYARTQM